MFSSLEAIENAFGGWFTKLAFASPWKKEIRPKQRGRDDVRVARPNTMAET
jgi:hypothetical protein